MGFIFSKVLNLLSVPKYYKILMLGLDFSGKSTILNKIKQKESVRIIPAIGLHIESLFYMGLLKIISWDLGGASRMRELFKVFYPNTDGIILVIDSNDKERFDDAIECFQNILEEKELKNCPILIMANKQDMSEILSLDEITLFLKNEKYNDRKWCIIKTSGINGNGLGPECRSGK